MTKEFEQDDHPQDTDTLQWCQLHRGHCSDLGLIRRHFENPNLRDEIFMACPNCIRDLKKVGLLKDSKFAKLPCVEVVVPQGLCNPKLTTRDPHRPRQGVTSSLLSYARQQSFEITLGPLQVKYLRALGLRVIPA